LILILLSLWISTLTKSQTYNIKVTLFLSFFISIFCWLSLSPALEGGRRLQSFLLFAYLAQQYISAYIFAANSDSWSPLKTLDLNLKLGFLSKLSANSYSGHPPITITLTESVTVELHRFFLSKSTDCPGNFLFSLAASASVVLDLHLQRDSDSPLFSLSPCADIILVSLPLFSVLFAWL